MLNRSYCSIKVMFACINNSARGKIAEDFLKYYGDCKLKDESKVMD